MDWAPPWGLVAVFVIAVIGSANSRLSGFRVDGFEYGTGVGVDGVNTAVTVIGISPVPRIEEVIFADFVKLLIDGADMFGDFLHYGK